MAPAPTPAPATPVAEPVDSDPAAPYAEPQPTRSSVAASDPCTPEDYSPSACETFYSYSEDDGAGNVRDCDSILGCGDWYAAYEVDREKATEWGDIEGSGGDSYCAEFPEDYLSC